MLICCDPCATKTEKSLFREMPNLYGRVRNKGEFLRKTSMEIVVCDSRRFFLMENEFSCWENKE